jgi:hypothetical protein
MAFVVYCDESFLRPFSSVTDYRTALLCEPFSSTQVSEHVVRHNCADGVLGWLEWIKILCRWQRSGYVKVLKL